MAGEGAQTGHRAIDHRGLRGAQLGKRQERLQRLGRVLHQGRRPAVERLGLLGTRGARQPDRGAEESRAVLPSAVDLGEERERLAAARAVGIGGDDGLEGVGSVVQRTGGERRVPQPELEPGALRGGKIGRELQRAAVVRLRGGRTPSRRCQVTAGEQRLHLVGAKGEQLVPRLGGEQCLSGAGEQVRPLGEQRRGLGGNGPRALGEELGQDADVAGDTRPACGECLVQLGRVIEGAILGGPGVRLASTGAQGLGGAQPAPGCLGSDLTLGARRLEPAEGDVVPADREPGGVPLRGRDGRGRTGAAARRRARRRRPGPGRRAGRRARR